ncbi:MAG TPA: uroporphyrinogen-III synthase [Dysgonamonadaceae bacterium]|jgi:uroporphyrinogen-III synthase|uniref:uroporphyrinogen-III synthase n=1 Tax=Seramator thermalis TaxID=2496270 RepID=UPI0009CE40F3|nr:uroporphyrinogen-III synthase [Seramator thermalis]MBP7180062.1 uroporphyrinogen-III synthase [Dysgonamonadaceae bacterium]OPZ13532.1 MAG: uroporphyrinogen-III synthase [Bacteroidetes bacterium ADurb.BinA261]MBP9032221.1 uroporphyrinogen-III synthase [Dysgonamonadaceae bacterium]HOM63931.1 uroporphyrinogen-III synthase [Dysgonamonadaceae bacterium]HOT64150.1 uroporphyrinogen-III synthase [Dysgonamonadaceae bacterium]
MNVRKVKKILISQPKPTTDKSPYYEIAEKFHVEIHFRPFIKVERVSVKEFRQQRINIPDYTAIVFTARTAIDHFFSLCEELRITMPETMKYFCISESVALYLQKYIVYRKRKIFFSQTGKIEGLNNAITKHSKEKFLVPLPDQHNGEVTRFLEEKKIDYTESVMYRTVSNDFDKDEPFDYDMVIFFSPAGVQSLFKNFPDFKQGDIAIGCFGSTTAKAVEEAGLRLDCEAPLPGLPSMTAALENFLKENHKNH